MDRIGADGWLSYIGSRPVVWAFERWFSAATVTPEKHPALDSFSYDPEGWGRLELYRAMRRRPCKCGRERDERRLNARAYANPEASVDTKENTQLNEF